MKKQTRKHGKRGNASTKGQGHRVKNKSKGQSYAVGGYMV